MLILNYNLFPIALLRVTDPVSPVLHIEPLPDTPVLKSDLCEPIQLRPLEPTLAPDDTLLLHLECPAQSFHFGALKVALNDLVSRG